MSVEEQLAWEARQRPRAAAAALLGGVLMLAGLVLGSATSRDQPRALLLDSLRNLERPGPIGGLRSARLPEFQYLSDHRIGLVATILTALSILAIVYAVRFLALATRARRRLPGFAPIAVVIGGGILAIALVISSILQQNYIADALKGARTVDSVGSSPTNSVAVGLTAFISLVAYGASLIVISLNAMRAGLLTRVMGYVGILAAGFSLLPPFSPAQPIIALWAVFLAPLLIGRWMGGQPPAWQTGKEEPWPTSQQMREQRSRAQGNLAEPDPEAVEERAEAVARPHPSSKKRKRKRRT